MRALLALALTAGSVVCTIRDPRLDEVSGIAVSLRTPNLGYVQNDSGDRNRVFAVDLRTGRTAATVTVAGATNVDWEDIAVARDAAGTASVYVADIGDNAAQRSEVRVYRVAEPRLRANADDRRITTARADVWRLRYPSGATDAESLAVAPGGTGYLVTKSVVGASVVYRLPPRPDPGRVQVLVPIGRIGFRLTGTPGGPNPIGQLTATGASFSADGATFVIRTYTDAYVWPVAGGDLAAALRRSPIRVALPAQPQGEGVAIRDGRLLLTSEGVGQPVYSVPLPPMTARTATPTMTTPTPTPTPAAPPTGEPSNGTATTPSNGTATTPSTAPDEPDEGDRSGRGSARYLVGGAVAILFGLAVLIAVRRRR